MTKLLQENLALGTKMPSNSRKQAAAEIFEVVAYSNC
jgi:hypothetical protein